MIYNGIAMVNIANYSHPVNDRPEITDFPFNNQNPQNAQIEAAGAWDQYDNFNKITPMLDKATGSYATFISRLDGEVYPILVSGATRNRFMYIKRDLNGLPIINEYGMPTILYQCGDGNEYVYTPSQLEINANSDLQQLATARTMLNNSGVNIKAIMEQEWFNIYSYVASVIDSVYGNESFFTKRRNEYVERLKVAGTWNGVMPNPGDAAFLQYGGIHGMISDEEHAMNLQRHQGTTQQQLAGGLTMGIQPQQAANTEINPKVNKGQYMRYCKKNPSGVGFVDSNGEPGLLCEVKQTTAPEESKTIRSVTTEVIEEQQPIRTTPVQETTLVVGKLYSVEEVRRANYDVCPNSNAKSPDFLAELAVIDKMFEGENFNNSKIANHYNEMRVALVERFSEIIDVDVEDFINCTNTSSVTEDDVVVGVTEKPVPEEKTAFIERVAQIPGVDISKEELEDMTEEVDELLDDDEQDAWLHAMSVEEQDNRDEEALAVTAGLSITPEKLIQSHNGDVVSDVADAEFDLEPLEETSSDTKITDVNLDEVSTTSISIPDEGFKAGCVDLVVKLLEGEDNTDHSYELCPSRWFLGDMDSAYIIAINEREVIPAWLPNEATAGACPEGKLTVSYNKDMYTPLVTVADDKVCEILISKEKIESNISQDVILLGEGEGFSSTILATNTTIETEGDENLAIVENEVLIGSLEEVTNEAISSTFNSGDAGIFKSEVTITVPGSTFSDIKKEIESVEDRDTIEDGVMFMSRLITRLYNNNFVAAANKLERYVVSYFNNYLSPVVLIDSPRLEISSFILGSKDYLELVKLLSDTDLVKLKQHFNRDFFNTISEVKENAVKTDDLPLSVTDGLDKEGKEALWDENGYYTSFLSTLTFNIPLVNLSGSEHSFTVGEVSHSDVVLRELLESIFSIADSKLDTKYYNSSILLCDASGSVLRVFKDTLPKGVVYSITKFDI